MKKEAPPLASLSLVHPVPSRQHQQAEEVKAVIVVAALAFAQRLKEEGTEAIFVGSQDRLEGQLIPEAGYRFIPLNIPNTSGSISGKIRYLLSMAGAIGECEKLLRSYHPDACVGFGNYISVPLILAAKKCRIPTMISEQNSFAGKANVFLGRFADAVEMALRD